MTNLISCWRDISGVSNVSKSRNFKWVRSRVLTIYNFRTYSSFLNLFVNNLIAIYIFFLNFLLYSNEKNLLFLEGFFLSSEKLNFKKENVIFLNTFLNFNLFYLIVVNFLQISFIWTFRTSGIRKCELKKKYMNENYEKIRIE